MSWKTLTHIFFGLFASTVVGIDVVRHFLSKSRLRRFGPGANGTQDVAFVGIIVACLFLAVMIVCGAISLIVGENWLR